VEGAQTPCQGSKCVKVGTTQSGKHIGIWGGSERWGRKAIFQGTSLTRDSLNDMTVCIYMSCWTHVVLPPTFIGKSPWLKQTNHSNSAGVMVSLRACTLSLCPCLPSARCKARCINQSARATFFIPATEEMADPQKILKAIFKNEELDGLDLKRQEQCYFFRQSMTYLLAAS
jgi:hypothetical protein